MAATVLIMVVAMSLIPLGDAAGKILITSYGVPPVTVAWTRFAIGALVMLPLILRHPLELRVLSHPGVLLRAGLFVAAICSILTALTTEPLPNVYGAFFVGPILSYALSVGLLGERAELGRFVLLLLGFIGVLMVVRPGFGMTPGMGFAVLAGTFYGGYLVASRSLAGRFSARGLMFAQLVPGAVVLSPGALALAGPAGTAPVGLYVLSGVASLAGNLLLILAYRRAPATRLAPLVYLQIVAATIYGRLVFGAWPDALALGGLMLIVASGFGSLAVRARA